MTSDTASQGGTGGGEATCSGTVCYTGIGIGVGSIVTILAAVGCVYYCRSRKPSRDVHASASLVGSDWSAVAPRRYNSGGGVGVSGGGGNGDDGGVGVRSSPLAAGMDRQSWEGGTPSGELGVSTCSSEPIMDAGIKLVPFGLQQQIRSDVPEMQPVDKKCVTIFFYLFE